MNKVQDIVTSAPMVAGAMDLLSLPTGTDVDDPRKKSLSAISTGPMGEYQGHDYDQLRPFAAMISVELKG
jgi:hypothetical protein